MDPDSTRLLTDALKLPPAARAAIAGSLLDSLDDSVDEDAEDAWDVEIAKRLEQLDRGTVKKIPWSDARRRIGGY